MDMAITHNVSAAWGNCKTCNGVFRDRNMPVKLKGRYTQNSIGLWSRDMVNNEKPRKETGGE